MSGKTPGNIPPSISECSPVMISRCSRAVTAARRGQKAVFPPTATSTVGKFPQWGRPPDLQPRLDHPASAIQRAPSGHLTRTSASSAGVAGHDPIHRIRLAALGRGFTRVQRASPRSPLFLPVRPASG